MIRNYLKWFLLGLLAVAVSIAPILALAQDATPTPAPTEESETPGTFIVILGPITLLDGAPTLNGFPLVFDLTIEIPVLTEGDIVIITGYLTPENTVRVLTIDVIVDQPLPDVTPTPTPDVTPMPTPEVTPTPDVPEESLCMDNHPVGYKLAAEFEVTYEDIMTMFCDGYGFGEIAIAYTLANGDADTLAEIRALREGGMGWGNIKKLEFDDEDDETVSDDTDLTSLTLVVVRGAEGKRGKFAVVEVKDADEARAKNVGRPDHAGKPDQKANKGDKGNNGKGNGGKGNDGKGNNGNGKGGGKN